MPIDTYAPRINQVANHVSADLAGDLSLTRLADLAGFSQFHFHRVFKQYTGENLNSFVVRRRLERATQLMRVTPRLPLTRIALDCGFESSSDFSRAFKRQFGSAPSSWDRLTPLVPLEDSKIRQTPAGFTLYTRAELEEMARGNEFEVRIEQRAAERRRCHRNAGSRRALNRCGCAPQPGGFVNLGVFSVSLNVEDIKTSRAFYERMGFVAFAGDEAQRWLVLKNGDANIGLFQGMFESNILTFNPTDVRSVQRALKAAGASFLVQADESSRGPAHAVLSDPDGNVILLDQHNA